MPFYLLILGVLAVWRITHVLNAEDGPGDIFVRVRKRAGEGFWGKLLDCFYCLSLWVALPFALWLGDTWKQRVLLWPALSAGAIMLERWSSPREHPAQYYEDQPKDGEHNDALLR